MQSRLASRGAVTIAAVLFALLAGCATTTADPGSSGGQGALTTGRTLDEIIAIVREDAARRTGVDRPDIRIIDATAVTWPDGSLGCPEPGLAYPQAMVPGYRVVAHAGERWLDYHASATGRLVVCPPGRAQPPVQGDAR